MVQTLTTLSGFDANSAVEAPSFESRPIQGVMIYCTPSLGYNMLLSGATFRVLRAGKTSKNEKQPDETGLSGIQSHAVRPGRIKHRLFISLRRTKFPQWLCRQVARLLSYTGRWSSITAGAPSCVHCCLPHPNICHTRVFALSSSTERSGISFYCPPDKFSRRGFIRRPDSSWYARVL